MAKIFKVITGASLTVFVACMFVSFLGNLDILDISSDVAGGLWKCSSAATAALVVNQAAESIMRYRLKRERKKAANQKLK